MNQLLRQLAQTTEFLTGKGFGNATVGVVLGTGLGKLLEHIQVELSLPYSEIPNFPLSTIEFHKGHLIYGKIGETTLIAMQGRFHYYEGYSMQQVTFPIRVMKRLGVDTLVVSNACGGMHTSYRRGDLMRIDDHINMIGDNPLRGQNLDQLGPRLHDMIKTYDR